MMLHRFYLLYLKNRFVAESVGGFLAVFLFVMPRSCLEAAIRQGIMTDYGCWFWIEQYGYKACKRHMQRPF